MKKKLITLILFILFFSCQQAELENTSQSEIANKKGNMIKVDYQGSKLAVFKDLDGNYIFNEDILLYKKDVKELSEPAILTRYSNADAAMNDWDEIETVNAIIWPTTNLSYKIDPNMPAAQKDFIKEGIADWESKTDIKMTESTAVYQVYFKRVNSGCRAYLGYPGNDQEVNTVSLSATCDKQSVIHEIGHVFGMIHEHQRINRDNFITISSKTINYIKEKYGPNSPIGNYYQSIIHNHKKEATNLADPFNFDIGSAMMYGSYPRNNLTLRNDLVSKHYPLYTKKDGREIPRPLDGLSAKDINWLKYHYSRKLILKNIDYNVINVKIRLAGVSDPSTISFNPDMEIILDYDKSQNKFIYNGSVVQQLDLNNGSSSDDINFSWSNVSNNITYETNYGNIITLIKNYTDMTNMNCYKLTDNDGIDNGRGNAIVEAVKQDNYVTRINLKRWGSTISTDGLYHKFDPSDITKLEIKNVNYETLTRFKIRVAGAYDTLLSLAPGDKVTFYYSPADKTFTYDGNTVQQIDFNDGSSNDDIDFSWNSSGVKKYSASSHYSGNIIDLNTGYIYGLVDTDGIDGNDSNVLLDAYYNDDTLYIDLRK